MSTVLGKCPPFGRLVPPCQLQRNQPVVFRWVIGLVLVHCAGAFPLVAFGNAGDAPSAELHWAFQPLVHPDVPDLDKPDRIRGPIDAFVSARLAAQGLCLSTDANRERLIRRAYFDLLGLPPGPAHVDAFLSDTRLDSYEQLVDRLLDSPQFGVRWGRHWLDIVGYTDSISFDDDYGPPIGFTEGKWRYRDYVVQSFNEDKPYDRFVTEQVAGDEMDNWRDATRFTPEILQHLIATGYLRCCEDISGEDKRPFIVWSVLHDTVAQLGTSLLGLSLNCARCHDHKFEPISQADYYSLVALLGPALNATDYPSNWKTPKERALPDMSPADFRQLCEHNARIDKQVDQLDREIASVRRPYAHRVRDAELKSIPDSDQDPLKAALDLPASEREDQDKELIEQYDQEVEAIARRVTAALSESDRNAVARLQEHVLQFNKQRLNHGWIMGVADVSPPPVVHLFHRGDHLQPRQQVPARFLAVLSDEYTEWLLQMPPTEHTSQYRTTMARWLTDRQSPASPLVARVMVNRVWQQLMGQGIVATPENLGTSGAAPTHPELLDWLAAEFVKRGWRPKPLIKEIMMSTVYRQASSRFPHPDHASEADAQPSPGTVDPTNHLLWRARLRRLEAEALRDAMLSISGKLDISLGGPPVPLSYSPTGRITVARKGLPTATSQWRRSLYLTNRRIYNPSFLSVFDKPTVTGCVCQRDQVAAPLQSLMMMNDSFVLEHAQYFAQRVVQEGGDSLGEQIELAYRLAFGRGPHPEEDAWSRELVKQQAHIYNNIDAPPENIAVAALACLCQTLMSANEFLYLE
jgi:hypothetical protein